MQRFVDFARQLWVEEEGFIVSAELIFIVTILVIGLVAGWGKIKAAVNEELNDISIALGNLDQSYFFLGVNAGGAGAYVGTSNGTNFDDVTDTDAGDSIDTATNTDGMAIGVTTVTATQTGETATAVATPAVPAAP